VSESRLDSASLMTCDL